MANSHSEYGVAGCVGVLVPRENPTVEPELSVLFNPDVAMLASRMTSDAHAMEDRLIAYGRELDRWIGGFGAAQLDIVAFACTGTSYLMDMETAANREGRGVSVISAAGALEMALKALQCRRLALVSPYPAALTKAAVVYWRGRGFDIVSITELMPAVGYHPIYAQSGSSIGEAIARATSDRPDGVVVLGTGAPSLAAIAKSDSAIPVLSPNLCLGWAIDAAVKGEDGAGFESWIAEDAPWRRRLRSRFPRAGSGGDAHGDSPQHH